MIHADPLNPGSPLYGWRLDSDAHASTWDSGLGAYHSGGRWNSPGRHTVYASLDSATAIVEVAVHKTFHALNTVAHTLTQFKILDPTMVTTVWPTTIPNPHWLNPVAHSPAQQAYGDILLATGRFIAIPSAVSQYSWNLVFDPNLTKGHYVLEDQIRFALDPRL